MTKGTPGDEVACRTLQFVPHMRFGAEIAADFSLLLVAELSFHWRD